MDIEIFAFFMALGVFSGFIFALWLTNSLKDIKKWMIALDRVSNASFVICLLSWFFLLFFPEFSFVKNYEDIMRVIVASGIFLLLGYACGLVLGLLYVFIKKGIRLCLGK